MARLTIYKDNYADSTVVSNIFIDQYMKDANDAQLKVYFYLIRMINANQAISVSGIADKFNHTEKDVIRALKYWEKHQLLDLDYDNDKNLVGIHLRDLSAPVNTAPAPQVIPSVQVAPTLAPVRTPAVPASSNENKNADKPAFSVPSYSLDQLKQFKECDATAQLLFVAESYTRKTLSASDINTIFFIKTELHFSDDLIDYLIQYCVDHGKRDFKYIVKVAISWAEQGVTTPQEAEKCALKYDKNVYTIMNELGKSTSPTTKEIEYINRWIKEYGFDTDIILEACARTVLATDNHRFEYAEGILNSWKAKNVHHKADIHKIDELYQKKKNAPKTTSTNKFNQFTQNSYNFDELEKEILSN